MATLGDLIVKVGADPGNFKEVMQDCAKTADDFASHVSDGLSEAAQAAVNFADTVSGALNKEAQSIVASQQELDVALSGSREAFKEIEQLYLSGAVSANTYARAAEELQSAFQNANIALADSKHHVEEAGKGFDEAAERLLKFGEALAVTEGLKELGQEALTAFGHIQKVEIALTALTGSAGGAKEAIEGLKELAISDALSFPTLVEAQLRMTAFGIETEKIPGALRAIADSAGATNKDFDSVASSFERMSLSGTASAKQLVNLGLSLHDLGQVLGVADDQVKNVFKDLLDPTERAQALTLALEKFAGVGAQVAAGIEGQWRNVGTQIHFVFEEIGKGLEPVISQLLEMINTDILPFIRALVEGFNELPTPVKDVAVVLGLALAAVVPLTAALAGLALAAPAIAEGLAAIGIVTTEAAVGAAALSAGAYAAGAAATVLQLKLQGVLEAAEDFKSALENMGGLGKFVEQFSDSFKGLKAIFEDNTKGLQPFFDLVKALLPNFQAISDYMPTWGQAIKGVLDQIAPQFAILRELLNLGTEHTTFGATQKTTLDFPGFVPQPSASVAPEADLKKTVALRQAAKDAKEVYQQMVDDARKFNDSVVELWNTFPATYEQYTDRLQEGGKKASASVTAIQAAIEKAASLAVGLTGKPLQDIEDWQYSLDKLLKQAEEFAATDAFYTAAQKISALVDKFPKQVEEISAADAAMGKFFADMVAGAANAPDAFNKFDPAAMTAKLLESQKQLDDQTTKLGHTFATAYDAYQAGVRKVGGYISDIKEKQDELNISSVSLRDHLTQAFTIPGPVINETVKLLSPMNERLLEAADDAMRLSAAVKRLGVDGSESGTQLIKDFNLLSESGKASLGQIEIAWTKVSGAVNKLAANDLPLAIREWEIYINDLKAAGAPQLQILNAEAAQLQLDIKLATQRGESATAYIIALDQTKRKIEEVTFASQALGKLYVDLMKGVDAAFSQAGKAIADNIVDGKNWGDVWHNIIKQIEKDFLEILIGSAFKALELEILRVTGLQKGLASLFGVHGAAPGGAGGTPPFFPVGGLSIPKSTTPPVQMPGAGELPPGATTPIPGDTGGIGPGGGGQTGGGGSGSGESSGGGLGSAVPLVSLGVQIASGITQGIQNSRMINLLGEIEISTRQCKEQLTGGTQTVLNSFLPGINHLVDIWGTIGDANNHLIDIGAKLDQLNDAFIKGVVLNITIGNIVDILREARATNDHLITMDLHLVQIDKDLKAMSTYVGARPSPESGEAALTSEGGAGSIALTSTDSELIEVNKHLIDIAAKLDTIDADIQSLGGGGGGSGGGGNLFAAIADFNNKIIDLLTQIANRPEAATGAAEALGEVADAATGAADALGPFASDLSSGLAGSGHLRIEPPQPRHPAPPAPPAPGESGPQPTFSGDDQGVPRMTQQDLLAFLSAGGQLPNVGQDRYTYGQQQKAISETKGAYFSPVSGEWFPAGPAADQRKQWDEMLAKDPAYKAATSGWAPRNPSAAWDFSGQSNPTGTAAGRLAELLGPVIGNIDNPGLIPGGGTGGVFNNAQDIIAQLRSMGKTNQEIYDVLSSFPHGTDFANALVGGVGGGDGGQETQALQKAFTDAALALKKQLDAMDSQYWKSLAPNMSNQQIVDLQAQHMAQRDAAILQSGLPGGAIGAQSSIGPLPTPSITADQIAAAAQPGIAAAAAWNQQLDQMRAQQNSTILGFEANQKLAHDLIAKAIAAGHSLGDAMEEIRKLQKEDADALTEQYQLGGMTYEQYEGALTALGGLTTPANQHLRVYGAPNVTVAPNYNYRPPGSPSWDASTVPYFSAQSSGAPPVAVVTVNALNPSARGVTAGIVQGLQQVGIRIR